MNSSLTNICLTLAALLYLLLFLPFFHSKIATSNDQGATGYVIIIIALLHLVILGLMGVAYVAIGREGNFQWVSGNASLRTMMVGIGLLSCMIISAMSFMSRIAPGNNPVIIQWMGRFAPVVILVIVVGTGFILNNQFLRDNIPSALYKWPLIMMNVACMVGVIIFATQILLSKQPSAQEATRKYESEETIKNSRLAEIDSADISNELIRILEFTGSVYPLEVRQKASAKIKTDSTWERDLINLMENDYALEVFSFLQSNDVENKPLFLQPVLTGVKSVAARIRHDIQGTNRSDFSSDMFSDEVNRVLRTVEKFEGMGVDYLPAVKEIRGALDEPRSNDVKFECVPVLEEWIRRRE